MARDTFTFKAEGEIELRDFTVSMSLLAEFVKTLSTEIAKGTTIRWRIEELKSGSAVAVFRGEVDTPDQVGHLDVPEKIVRGIGIVATSLLTGDPIPYSHSVQEAAFALTRAIKDSITAIHLQTDETEVVLTAPVHEEDEKILKTHALGTVEGIVDTLRRRDGYSFTLYDVLLDRSVRCYFRPDQEDLMRRAWGKHVRVTGRIGRDPVTGRAIDVHDVWDVSTIPPVLPGSYKDALGILPNDDALPEVLVRKSRDDG
jgi:hypothetical protein